MLRLPSARPVRLQVIAVGRKSVSSKPELTDVVATVADVLRAVVPVERECVVFEGEKFAAFERSLTIRKAIDKALRQRGVNINVAMEFDNIETIKQAITIQSSVSILPQPSVTREVESGVLAAIPMDMPELVRPIGIIYRRHKLLTPTADKLLDFLQSQKH